MKGKIDFDEETLTIMDVEFRTEKEFKVALYSIMTNLYKGIVPTKEIVEGIKDYFINKED